jgi:uncharacterized OB-fold protein
VNASSSPETQAFWDACRDGRLTFQRCRDCKRAQFYPRAICSHCQSKQLDIAASAGNGHVYSFTVVHRAPSAEFRSRVPYVLALIDLDEGFRLMANVMHCDPASVTIGMTVRLTFETVGEQRLPQFEPASGV